MLPELPATRSRHNPLMASDLWRIARNPANLSVRFTPRLHLGEHCARSPGAARIAVRIIHKSE